MKYMLDDEKIDKAKQFIKHHNKQKAKWQKEIDKAEEYLANCPQKYYMATKARINSYKKEIEKINETVKDLKDAIKKGYIEI